MGHWYSAFIPGPVSHYIGSSRYYGWREQLRATMIRAHATWRHRNVPKGLVRFPGGPTLRVDDAACRLYHWFAYEDGIYVEEMRSFIRFSQARMLLYDVGAEAGCFSLVFASRPGARAVAFEPSPPQIAKLRTALELNPDHRVDTMHVAIGPADGEITMTLSDVTLYAGAGAGAPEGTRHRVPMRSIDSLANERGEMPDTIKIDIEGFELGALQGAEGCLSTARPILFLEVHPKLLPTAGHSVEELVQFLRRHHYDILDLSGRPMRDPVAFTRTRIRRWVCVAM